MANIRVNNLGADGIISSLNLWKSKSDTIHVLGIHDSEEDTLTIVEVNGLKIALLDYTAVIEKALANDETYLVDFFGSYANGQADLSTLSEQTLEDIDLANKTSDFVVVFASWGLDDTHEITAAQERFAKQLTEAGADLIIGNRPNNLQKVEWITADNGNRALCYYSLGNFISSENTAGALVGGIAKVGIHVENGLTVIDEANTGLIPVVTQYTYSGTGDEVDVSGTVPFSQYTDEMAAGHGLTAKYGSSLDRETVQGILDAVVPAEFLITE
jgi:poly-gamma-glutamate synthesis protein (capsule biosynthesis protein)